MAAIDFMETLSLPSLSLQEYVGDWCIGEMRFSLTKKPSWRQRTMMRIFFDWKWEDRK
jgi:hypothetical protein